MVYEGNLIFSFKQVIEDFSNPPGQRNNIRPTANKNQFKSLKKMANHKGSLKRIRQDKVKTAHYKYYAKTMRNAVRKLRATTDKAEAVALYPKVQKMLDKLA